MTQTTNHLGILLTALSVGCVWAELSTVQAAEETRWPLYKPRAVEPPNVEHADLVRNPVDAFILRKLEQQNLTPAPEADRRTLIRRLTLDLVGLPPTPAEVEAFLSDKDSNAYEKVVHRLLKDPRYGERWARFWLDLARYADTAGYEGDPDLPHVWRYRDYVIDAFNNDAVALGNLSEATNTGALALGPFSDATGNAADRASPETTRSPRAHVLRHRVAKPTPENHLSIRLFKA